MNNAQSKLKQALIRACEEEMADIVRFAPRRHGDIANKMTQLMGLEKPILRQSVARWVDPDPERREHPRIGYFHFLKKAVQQLKKTKQ